MAGSTAHDVELSSGSIISKVQILCCGVISVYAMDGVFIFLIQINLFETVHSLLKLDIHQKVKRVARLKVLAEVDVEIGTASW